MIKDGKLTCDNCHELLAEKTPKQLLLFNKYILGYHKDGFAKITCFKCQHINIFEASFLLPFFKFIDDSPSPQN